MAVEIGYRVRPEQVAGLPGSREPAARPAPARRRDLLARLPRPGRARRAIIERFIVTSWADYLHQRARATLADQELEAALRVHLADGEVPTLQHYIAER